MNLFDTLLQGVLLGGLYALFAAGLSLIFGVMRLVNIAHGDFIVLGSFMALTVTQVLGIGPLASLLAVVPLMALLGYAAQRLVLNRTLGADVLPPLLVTFGLSVIIQNALLGGFSADSRRLSPGSLETASVEVLGTSVGLLPLLTFAAAVLVIGGLELFFARTRLGRAFRATSDDSEMAAAIGVSNRHVFALAMALSAGIVGVAAVFLAMRSSFDPFSAPARLICGFEAVIIGGLGSFWGTLAGGVALGIAQMIGAQISPNAQALAGHIFFFAVLALRPRGLFPRMD